MFGGLFCAYAVYRSNHPEVYLFAHQALNPFWGMVNTIVLLASSFTMAWGVRAAQLNQRGLLQVMLILTFLGGVVFMCVKGVEYKEKWEYYLFPGRFNAFNSSFSAPRDGETSEQAKKEAIDHIETHGKPSAALPSVEVRDVDFISPTGHEGGNIAESVQNASMKPTSADAGELIFKHRGRNANVEASVIGDVAVARLSQDGNIGGADAALIAAPNFAPAGTNLKADEPEGHHHKTFDELAAPDRATVNAFFSIYFMMTGLHGVHVLVGMALMVWLFLRASKGEFTEQFFTPVDLGGLYWHLVDLIWIFLFPLLYLIH